MSISWDLTPHGGGDHVLFQHFSSPQGRQSCPFLILLLPAGEALMSFFNISPPCGCPRTPAGRFGGRKFLRKRQYFLLDGRKCSPKAVNFLPERILMVGNGLESERSSYCKVGRMLKNMLTSYQLALSKMLCGRN